MLVTAVVLTRVPARSAGGVNVFTAPSRRLSQHHLPIHDPREFIALSCVSPDEQKHVHMSMCTAFCLSGDIFILALQLTF